MALEIVRKLVGGVWRTVLEDQGSGPGSTPNLAAVLAEGADAGGSAITGLDDPTADQDAATKKYVDDNGGSVTVKLVPIEVAYTDFVADGGGEANAPLYTLPLNEIFIAGGFRITETFDDSAAPGFTIVTFDVSDGAALSGTFGPNVNTPIDGLVGLIHDDLSNFGQGGVNLVMPDTAPVELAVNASWAGDGTTGALIAVLLIGVLP